MKKFFRDSRTSLAMGVFLFFTVVAVLSMLAAEYQNLQTDDYEEILTECAPDGVLVYGADDSAPPLRFVDEDGVYKGVVVDYVGQLSLELGIEISAVPYKWDDAIRALKEGKTDLCDMFVNEERSKHFVFTDPIYTLRTVMVVRTGNDYNLTDIHSMRVATQKGDYANGYMETNYPDAELTYVHDVGEGLQLLMEGKVDGVIGDEPVVSYYAGELGISEQIGTIGTSLYEEPVCLALQKEKSKLVPVLNQAIKTINEKGQLEKIQQKWFGISTPLITTRSNATTANFLGIMVFAFACAILLVHLNNRSLRREVNKRTRELEARKNELQLIFDQMPEGVILTDEQGKLINGNYRFFGERLPGKSLVDGLPCSDFLQNFCGNQQCRGFCSDPSACIIADTLQKEKSVIKKVQMDNCIYEIRSVPTSFSEKSTRHHAVLLMVRDITVDEASSQKLLQSSKMIAIGQLAGGMAHQIRNPLGIIRTQSFIIRNSHRDDRALNKSLDFVDDSVKRASEIIDNVMNFWRVSDDTLTEIRVRQLLESVVLLQEKDFSSAGIQVDIDCDASLLLVSSEDALKHILHNLAANSVDAMEHGGRLCLKAEKDGGFVALSVEDTGCGISEKNKNHLFNPFFTTKEPGKGTGLGLFIVYSEVEKLGGTIEVTSREGEGTTFLIRVPQGQV